MKNLSVALFLVVLSLTACNNAGNETTGATTTTDTASTPGIGTPTITAEPVPGDAAASGMEAVSNPNPPHGEPGHRCDIAVGASLDSPPSTETDHGGETTTDAATTITPAITTAPAGEGSGKINPPHGEPGHRCDIAVGAPLP